MDYDIHIRDINRPTFKALPEHDLRWLVTFFPTLCGLAVRVWELTTFTSNATDYSQQIREPTCMGCILVEFQNKVDDGT